MSRATTRRLAVAAAATTCLAAAAAPALAEPTASGTPSSAEVSLTSAGSGTRQLQLLDLAGAPLTELALRPGAPSPFRVRVTDTGVGQLTDATSGFTVSATLNNLYAAGDPTAVFIPSSDVDVSFPAGGALSSAGSLTALPRTLLNGTIDGCSGVADILAILPSLDLLSATDLCDAIGSGGITIADLEVTAAAERALTDIADVPFALAGQETGAFTLADYVNGIGSGDSRGSGSGTPRGLLKGVPSTADIADELAGIVASVQALAPISADGTNAQTSSSAVVGELLASGDAALAGLGDALAALTPTQVASFLSGLSGTVQTIGLGDILSATGTYNSVPVLTATPTTMPAAGGTYSGTMTVTLVQP